jgi:putative peptidoglycan lipid II flippase
MSVGTALSRITGLLRVAAMTYALGVTGTRLADTYNLANTTPNIIYELFLGGILTAVFVPVLIGARERSVGDASALVSVSLVALAVVSGVATVGAPFIMRIYTFRVEDPTVRAAQLELATFLLRWFAPQIFFYGLSGVAQALLNVRGRFGPAAFAPLVNNLIVAGVLFTYARVIAEQGLALSTGAKTLLGVGTTAGVVAQALVLMPYLRGEGLRFRPRLRDESVAQALRLAAFVIVYVIVNQLGLWVVLALANGVRGGVTSWQVAYMFFQLPHGLVAVSLYTALFPDLSRAVFAQAWDAFRRNFAIGARGIAYLLVPAAIGYAILAEPVTRLIIARGVADAADAAAVASVLRAFAWGLAFFSSFHLLMRCFYALQDTRTPTMLNAVEVAFHTMLNFPLFAWLGVKGLAYGHAIAYALATVLLAVVLGRRIPGGLQLSKLTAPLVRIVVAAAVMGAAVWAVKRWVPGGDVAVVAVAVAAGALLYLAVTTALGADEPAMFRSLLARRNDPSDDG